MGSAPAPPESERTLESVRAQRAHEAVQTGPRGLAKARLERLREFGRRFDAICARLRLEHGDAYSNGAIARSCSVDEKIVRQWRNGEKEPGATKIALFPSRLRAEVRALLDELAELEGRSPEPWIVQLHRAVDAPNARVTEEDAPALDLVIGRLGELRRKAMGER